MASQEEIDLFGPGVLQWETFGVDYIERDLGAGINAYVVCGHQVVPKAAAWVQYKRAQQREEERKRQMDDQDQRASRERLRYRILRQVYDGTGGRQNAAISWVDLAEELGYSTDEIEPHLDWLVEESLLVEVALGGMYGMTHRGIREIEDLQEHPGRPTAHFKPFVVNQYGGNMNLAVGDHNRQTISVSPKSADVMTLLTDLASADGGVPSAETLALVAALESPGLSKTQAATVIEPLTSKPTQLAILDAFQKKIGERLGDAAFLSSAAILADNWSHFQAAWKFLTHS